MTVFEDGATTKTSKFCQRSLYTVNGSEAVPVTKNTRYTYDYETIAKETIFAFLNKNISALFLLSCSTGATNDSIASEFAKNTNGAVVIAPTNASNALWLPFLGSQAYGEGWATFVLNENGNVDMNLLNEHWLTLKEMIDIVKKSNNLCE